ncbi:MAG: hypothetical protein D6814_16760, partial [Calditrichaeota bacterium]
PEALAQLNWVRWIEGVHPIGEAALPAHFQPRDSRELISSPYVTQYRGNGVTVGLYDTGIRKDHAAFSGRIDFGDNDTNGHGTHVAGIIGASDVDGETYQGVAPLARLYVMSFNQHTIPETYDTFVNNNIFLVNNSWFFLDASEQPMFNYDANTEMIDRYADDDAIDLPAGKFRKPLALIFAAGNSGSLNSRSITNPGTGKNVLTVGAIDYTLDGNSGLGNRAHYSSVGPTQEGRLKPELVAPGGDASENDLSPLQAQNGVVSANAFGTLNPSDLYWPANDQYVRLKGTSMATPHVTGAAALAIDYWESQGFDWTFTDLKAHLINNAIPIKENDGGPLSGFANTRVGYGLLNAFSTLFSYENESRTVLWAKGHVIEETNTIDNWTFEVPPNTRSLLATLAYSDLPGRDLQDDLDLILLSPDSTQFQYVLPLNVDAESPVEKIAISSPQAGTWTAQVVYQSWPDDPTTISSEQYTVVAAIKLQSPALALEAKQSVADIKTGDNFQLQVTVTNSGGYIAAGVSVHLEDPANQFSGEANQGKFVGNLIHNGAQKTVVFNLTAPNFPGTYSLQLRAEGINRDLTPVSKSVVINVKQGTPTEQFKITNLIPSSYQVANLKEGDPYYIDRTWKILSIPADFQGLIWIKTAYNDYFKAFQNVRFDINQKSKVY